MANKKKLIAGTLGLGALGAMGAGLGIVSSQRDQLLMALENKDTVVIEEKNKYIDTLEREVGALNISVDSLMEKLSSRKKHSDLLLHEIGALNDTVEALLEKNVNHIGFYKTQMKILHNNIEEIKVKLKDIEALEQQIQDMEEVDVVGYTMDCLATVRKTGNLPDYLSAVDNKGENWIQHHNTIIFNELKDTFNRGEEQQKKWDSMLACYNWASVKVFSKFKLK